MFSPIEVKEELQFIDGELFCNTCLATDRALRPLQQYNNLCQKLFDKINLAYGLDHMSVCWECLATVRSVTSFVEKVRVAQDILRESKKIPTSSLSSLTPVLITDCNVSVIKEECSTTEKLDVVKVEHDSKEVIIHIPKVDDNEATKPLTDIKDEHQYDSSTKDKESYCIQNTVDNSVGNNGKDNADIKDDYQFDSSTNENESFTNEHTVDNSIENKVTRQRNFKDRNRKFKIIDEELSHRNNYRKVRINEQELKYWLETDRELDIFTKCTYRCETCILGFVDKKKLTEHNNICHSKEAGRYICDICQTRIHNKNALSLHCRYHYYKFKCDLCQYECHRCNLLYEHFRKEHHKKFQCLKCGLSFRARSEFFKHYKKMHQSFKCDYCGKCHVKKHSIISHIKHHHLSNKCHICNKVFKSYRYLRSHNNFLHDVTHDSDAYCVECNLQFDNNALFKRHLRTSVKHKPKEKRSFPCPECNKVYAKVCTLNYHYKFVHKQEPKFNCDQCNKPFLNGYRLRLHKASVHDKLTIPRNKICNLCGRGFSTNTILLNHMRTHTGERPFCCQYCPAAFAQKTAMKVHVRNIHFKEKNKLTDK